MQLYIDVLYTSLCPLQCTAASSSLDSDLCTWFPTQHKYSSTLLKSAMQCIQGLSGLGQAPLQRKSLQGHALRQIIKLVLPAGNGESLQVWALLQSWIYQRSLQHAEVMKCCENYSKLVCEGMKN